jgi:hypothetical protein
MVVKPRTISDAKTLGQYPESTLKVTQGLHRESGGTLTVFNVEMNGRNFQFKWADNVPMLPFMADVLLDDMQIGLGEDFLAQESLVSLKEYCLEKISNSISFSGEDITIGKMRQLLWSFYHAFMSGREDNDPALSEY